MTPAPAIGLARIHSWLRRIPTLAVYALCMMPAGVLVTLAFSNHLGPDPGGHLVKELGQWGLRLLLLGLVITPLREITGLALIRFRRVVGLAAFTTIALHLLGYIWLYSGFDLARMLKDISKRPFIILGMAAFVLLVPLAITSTNAMIRRLGALNWRRLHKLVFPAVVLGAVHFVLLVKALSPEPFIYLGLAVLLTGWRLVPKARR